MTVYEPDPENLKKLLSLTGEQFSRSRLAIKIYSEALDCEIYLISDPSFADQVDGVAYTPEEIGELMKIRKAVKPHYEERLKKIHDAKKIFKGKIVNRDDQSIE